MTEEIQGLLTKAERCLRSARLLTDDGDLDSAASRLYYAMFYCAEVLWMRKNLSFSSHRGVISGFAQHLVKTGVLPPEMRLWLREGFQQRLLAEPPPADGMMGSL